MTEAPNETNANAIAAWQMRDWIAYVEAESSIDIVDAIVRVVGALGAVPFDPEARLSETLPAGFDCDLRAAWIGHDRKMHGALWLWLLRTLRNSGQHMMSPAMREAHAALPPIVQVWRGFSLSADSLADIEAAARGTSWTTDRAVAESYAWSSQALGLRCLARATVPRGAIHTFFGEWYLSECIIDRPDEIENTQVKRLALPSPTPRLLARSDLAALAGLGSMFPSAGRAASWLSD